MEPDKKLDFLAHKVIGAAIEVHRHLGPGWLESVYESALVQEFKIQGIRVEQQKVLGITYKGRRISSCRLDLLVEGQLIIELKATERLLPIHHAQLISYLKASNQCLGLLINFNVTALKNGLKRVILSH